MIDSFVRQSGVYVCAEAAFMCAPKWRTLRLRDLCAKAAYTQVAGFVRRSGAHSGCSIVGHTAFLAGDEG